MGGLTLGGAILAAVTGSELNWGAGLFFKFKKGSFLKSSKQNVHQEPFCRFLCILVGRYLTPIALKQSSAHVIWMAQELGALFVVPAKFGYM